MQLVDRISISELRTMSEKTSEPIVKGIMAIVTEKVYE